MWLRKRPAKIGGRSARWFADRSNGAKLRATLRPLRSTRGARRPWRVVNGRLARATVSAGRVLHRARGLCCFAHSFENRVASASRHARAASQCVSRGVDRRCVRAPRFTPFRLTCVSRVIGSTELQFDLNECASISCCSAVARWLTLYSVADSVSRAKDWRSDWWFFKCDIYIEKLVVLRTKADSRGTWRLQRELSRRGPGAQSDSRVTTDVGGECGLHVRLLSRVSGDSLAARNTVSWAEDTIVRY